MKQTTNIFINAVTDVITEQGATNNVREYVNAIATKTGLSVPNVYYRLRNAIANGLITETGQQVTRATVTPEPVNVNKAIEPVNVETVTRAIATPEPIPETPLYRNEPQNENNVFVIETPVNVNELIPEPVNGYIERANVDSIIERYGQRYNNKGQRHVIALQGESGTGKTTAVEHYASKHKLPFCRISFDETTTLREFVGGREIINGKTVYKTGVLFELIKRPCVILFDEFNAIDSKRLFFLHELLQNRKLFVKEFNGGQTFKVNNDALFVLACNPNTVRYTGTNKINVALANRVNVTVNVPEFETNEIKPLFETGNDNLTRMLQQFYNEIKQLNREQNLRFAFSLRNVETIVNALRNGDNVSDALKFGLLDNILLTATEREQNTVKDIALVVFGTNYETLTVNGTKGA